MTGEENQENDISLNTEVYPATLGFLKIIKLSALFYFIKGSRLTKGKVFV